MAIALYEFGDFYLFLFQLLYNFFQVIFRFHDFSEPFLLYFIFGSLVDLFMECHQYLQQLIQFRLILSVFTFLNTQ